MERLLSKFKLISLLPLLSVMVIVSICFYCHFEIKAIRKQKLEELRSVAELKIQGVSNWYADQMYDALAISQNYVLIELVEKYNNGRKPSDLNELIHLLSSIKTEHNYENLLLYDTLGNIMLSLNDTLRYSDPVIAKWTKQMIDLHSVTSSDLYFNQLQQKIYIDFVSPLVSTKTRSQFVMIYRVDPDDFLFPFIKSWPGQKQTSETLIFRLHGDSIVNLNRSHFGIKTALNLKFPDANTESLTEQTISEYCGIVSGIDYRNKKVIAYFGRIPETPWYLVAKIDKKEFFKEIFQRYFLISILTLLLLVLTYTAQAYFFNKKQNRKYKALLETREEHRTILNGIDNGVITTDIQGRIQQLNPVAEKITGWKLSKAFGHELDKILNFLINEEEEPTNFPLIKHFHESKFAAFNRPMLLIDREKKNIPVNVRISPIKNQENSIVGSIIIINDQSNEKIKQQIIDESENRFEIFMNNMPACIVIKDNELRPIYANKLFREYFPISEWMGKKPDEIFPSEIAGAMIENDLRALEKGNISYSEQWYDKNGNNHFFETHKFRIDRGNEAPYLGAIILDISLYKNTETELAREKHLFESLIDTIPDNIYFKDTKSRFMVINKNMTKAFGLNDPKEAIGKMDSDYFDKQHAEQTIKDEKLIIESGIPMIGKEEKEVWLNGRTTWVNTTKVPLRDEEGHIIGIMGISRDITQTIRDKQALRDSEERYKRVSELTSDYIYKIDCDADQNLTISFLSESFYSITGRQMDMIKDMKTWSALFHPEDLPKVNQFILQLFASRQNGEFECRTYIKGNQMRWVSILAKPLVDKDQKRVIGIIGSVKDITARKSAEDALRASEEKHRILLDESTDPIFAIGSDGRYLYVNRAFANGVEKPVDQIIGKKLEDGFGKEVSDKRIAALRSVLRSGKEKVIEVMIPQSDGDRYYISTITPIKNSDADVISVICLSKDITSRKMIEKTLQMSQFSIDKAMTAVFWMGHDGGFTYVNEQACKSLGYSEEELLKLHLWDIDPIYPKELWYTTWEKFRENKLGGADHLETLHRKKDGAQFPVEVLSQHIWLGDAELHVSYVQDITERNRAQTALKESEEIFKNFLEHSPVYVFFKDENIRSLKLSRNFETMLGKPLEELLGKSMDELFPSDLAKSMIKDDKSILSEKKLVVVDEELNGRYYTTIKYPIQIDDKTRYLAGFSIDITEKKKAEEILKKQNAEIEKQNKEYALLNAEYFSLNEELRTSNEELAAARDKAQESDRLKSTFLANMSHEIRTPMNAIIGFSDLLNNRDLKPEKQQQFTHTIRQRSYDLLTLINDILDISKIEAGQMTIFEESGNLEEVMHDILTTFKAIWSDSGKSQIELRYENHLQTNENKIETDIGRLRQIISNLIGNAFKFTTEGSITFGCRRSHEQFLEFYVKDTGIGIPVEKQEIIFDRFRQADELFSHRFGGTGLGLSISKGLVELLGGKIWVESVPGEGSNFFFTIPYIADHVKYEPVQEIVRVKRKWSKYKALLVEDDEFNSEYIEEALKETGIQIKPVIFGKEAIDLIEKAIHFDVVLLDFRLPDMEGFEVAKHINRIRPNLPIVAQTAFASEQYRKRCLEAGCCEYLAKPIRKDDLLNAVGRCIEKK